MKTPEYKCPACNEILDVERVPTSAEEKGTIFLFCAHGNCPSNLMNDGIEGSSLDSMHKELVDIWNEEKPL